MSSTGNTPASSLSNVISISEPGGTATVANNIPTAGSASHPLITNVNAANQIYSISTLPTKMTMMNTTIDESDITIRMSNGTELRVGKSIRMILDHLMLIVPDDRELESNPALKAAYENYLRVYTRQFFNPELIEAYESYRILRNLSEDE